MHASPRAARRASPLPSSRELLRAVGRGRGWGEIFGNAGLDRGAPTRRVAFSVAPPSPPPKRVEDARERALGGGGMVPAAPPRLIPEMCASLGACAGTTAARSRQGHLSGFSGGGCN